MATILPSSSYQTYSDSRVDLVVAYKASTVPVVFKIHKNPMYNESIFEASGSFNNDVWYTTLTNQIPSSWITISINENDVWSSPHTFYILDDQNYASQYIPSYMPFIRHQWVRDDATDSYIEESGNCVACALATMKEIHEYKEGKGSQQFYSTGWIYGNRLPSHSQNEGMIYTEALDQLKSDGVPYYKLLPENAKYLYPDNYFYTKTYPRTITAKQLVVNNRTSVLDLSKPQRISGYTEYNQWVSANVKARIIADGCVLITCDLYNNCYPHSNGIFPENISGSFIDGHMMAIIGWKKINNKNYWICANSWGSWNGDNGLYYMPFVTDIPRNFYFVTDGNYPAPLPPIPSAPLIDTSVEDSGRYEYNGTAGLALKWGSVSGATQYRVKFRRGYDNYTTSVTFSTNSGKTYNLGFGTTYFISVCAGNNNGWSDYSAENQGTTAPQTPSIYTKNVTNNPIRINLNSIVGDWSYVEIYRSNNVGTLLGTATINKSGQQYVDYNITADTKFTARAFLTIGSTSIRSVNISNEILFTAVIKPTAWAWSINELNAFNNKGATSTLTYDKWNSFIDKIIEFRNYKNMPTTVVINGTTYNITTAQMASSNKTLTALKFNIARQAIGEMYVTGILSVSKGDTVFGSYFITIASSLNSVS